MHTHLLFFEKGFILNCIALNCRFHCFRADFEQCLNAYTSLTLEKAADSKCPLLFASFPSAKDPSWAQKYKGMYMYTFKELVLKYEVAAKKKFIYIANEQIQFSIRKFNCLIK